MGAPVVSFKQRNNFAAKVELTLHPDYVEFDAEGIRGGIAGFNVKYELLPNEFYFRTFNPKDIYIKFPLILVSVMTLFELVVHHGDPFFTVGFMALNGLVYCALGYGLRHLLKKPYTVLATGAGSILIVKNRKHDLIVRELMARRAMALKGLVVINRLEPPWREVKKFKWLCDEGIISSDDFKMYRDRILSSVEPEAIRAFSSQPLH